jgi:hypothetical protein
VTVVLYVIAALEVNGALLTIAFIGKPRKPLTPTDAVIRVILAAASATLLVLVALGGMH